MNNNNFEGGKVAEEPAWLMKAINGDPEGAAQEIWSEVTQTISGETGEQVRAYEIAISRRIAQVRARAADHPVVHQVADALERHLDQLKSSAQRSGL